YEGHRRWWRGGMHGTSRQFLSRSGFTVNQNAPVSGRRDHDLLPERAHRDALADHYIVVQLLSQAPIVSFELALAQRVVHRYNGALDLERFLYKVERAQLGGANRGGYIAMTADHYDGRFRIECFQPFQCFDSIHPRQPYIQQNAREDVPLERAQALLA